MFCLCATEGDGAPYHMSDRLFTRLAALNSRLNSHIVSIKTKAAEDEEERREKRHRVERVH